MFCYVITWSALSACISYLGILVFLIFSDDGGHIQKKQLFLYLICGELGADEKFHWKKFVF